MTLTSFFFISGAEVALAVFGIAVWISVKRWRASARALRMSNEKLADAFCVFGVKLERIATQSHDKLAAAIISLQASVDKLREPMALFAQFVGQPLSPSAPDQLGNLEDLEGRNLYTGVQIGQTMDNRMEDEGVSEGAM